MFGSAILEVAAGLVLVFLLVSLVCSEIGNKMCEWLYWRARDLEVGIRDSIFQGNQELLAALYYSPLISSLAPQDSRLVRLLSWLPPSGQLHTGQKPIHIPPRTFALALFDAFVPGANRARPWMS
jgi:hypothetical protein